MNIENIFSNIYKNLAKYYNEFFLNKVITLYPDKNTEIKGRVLLSYLHLPVTYSENDIRLNGHSNKWESREIAKIFAKKGYIVDAIHFLNKKFYPKKKYDIVFDIDANISRLAPHLDKNTLKILHITGSYPPYQYNAEMERINNFKNRKNALYEPKRIPENIELFENSLNTADICSLIGNSKTLETFPQKYQDKINLVTVSSSKLSIIKSEKDYLPLKREFLWFFSYGAVHKGLDLLIDIFSKNPNITLNIIGNVSAEKDFMKIYEYELNRLPNIKYYGFLKPDSKTFKDILNNVFCFIAPTASEAISTAVATCLQIGLYPIISKDTGVNLPADNGIYLESCSFEEIQKAINTVLEMDSTKLKKQIQICQSFALEEFSREKFSEDMTKFIEKAIKQHSKFSTDYKLTI